MLFTMTLLNIIALGLYSLGAAAFGALCLDFFGSWRSWRQAECDWWVNWVGGTMMVVCFVWFLNHLLILFIAYNPAWNGWYPPQLLVNVLVFTFPPLIAASVLTEAARPGRLGTNAKIIIGLFALASTSVVTWYLLVFFRGVATDRRLINPVFVISIGALFGLVSILAIVVMRAKSKDRETSSERGARRSTMVLFGGMLIFALLIFLSLATDASIGRVLSVIGSLMPLMFVFTAVYHANRFEFFDLFFKRGVALVLTAGLLAAWFAFVLPILDVYRQRSIGPFLLAVAALPLAIVLPWLYRRLSKWVDSRWLGRRFTTVEAVNGFLSTLQTATGEGDLLERAEQGLSTIFRAPTRVDLELRQAAESDFVCVQEVPIRSGDRRIGVIRMGPRTNQMPYFSEDIALLASLSDVFSYMLQNVRLQAKKQEQEQRSKELAHQASLSELKALRAQINPHFLFNALNAIAGLIHKDPFRADSTVEQLAEVFRYTLRGSEKEWVRLEDEVEFVEAYLAVEHARFGERLQVQVKADADVGSIRIPTMIVQTVVENAVKHGVAAVRGQARIEIRARRDGQHLLIEVADNGPGFPDEENALPRQQTKGASFGLKSIRERFQGYFGDRAQLSIKRDEERGMTVVQLSMPLDHGLGSEPGQTPRGSTGVA